MNILFRADSSSKIGTGHIMRDLVLANQFPKDRVIFATRKLSGNINYKIEESTCEIKYLDTNEFEEVDGLIKSLSIDMLVIDHYEIDYEFEKKLKELNPNLKIFVLDDTYEKHYCDILLNHNISAYEKKYKNLVPKNCKLRCGAKYTLLRDEFYKIKNKKTIKKISKEKTFFIAMGGADHSNINKKILEVLEKNSNLKVKIVTTSANKNLKTLIKYCKKREWIDLYINSNEIAKIMNESDFAIVTPSVTVNEIYFLDIPMIAIKTAQNQIDMYQFLKKKRYQVINKFSKRKFGLALNQLKKKYYGKY